MSYEFTVLGQKKKNLKKHLQSKKSKKSSVIKLTSHPKSAHCLAIWSAYSKMFDMPLYRENLTPMGSHYLFFLILAFFKT